MEKRSKPQELNKCHKSDAKISPSVIFIIFIGIKYQKNTIFANYLFF